MAVCLAASLARLMAPEWGLNSALSLAAMVTAIAGFIASPAIVLVGSHFDLSATVLVVAANSLAFPSGIGTGLILLRQDMRDKLRADDLATNIMRLAALLASLVGAILLWRLIARLLYV
jgi:hypothetical protein